MASSVKTAAKTASHHTGTGRGEYRSPKLLEMVTGLMAKEDKALKAIRENTVKDGLPPISIGPDEGKLLDVLVRLSGAKKAVEVGTLAGYSAAWIARALPEDGVLYTVEYAAKHAQVARKNLKAAGVSAKVEVLVGAGRDVLPTLEPQGPFEFVFIDADKVNYPHYLRWAIANTEAGTVIVCDNAYLFGKLHLDPKDAGEDAPGVPAMREVLRTMADTELFSSCAMIPTGEGMAVAIRK